MDAVRDIRNLITYVHGAGMNNKMTPTFIKLELEQITNERLERLKQQLTLIGIEDNLLVFRVDKKWCIVSTADIIMKNIQL